MQSLRQKLQMIKIMTHHGSLTITIRDLIPFQPIALPVTLDGEGGGKMSGIDLELATSFTMILQLGAKASQVVGCEGVFVQGLLDGVTGSGIFAGVALHGQETRLLTIGGVKDEHGQRIGLDIGITAQD